MAELPFNIPPSLVSYLEQFEAAPNKTTVRLQKQLQKRGPDPVGYFLLGWFYHRREQHEQAVHCALKAKTYAPGSPFFEKLHYFFSHPDLFDAWNDPGSPGKAEMRDHRPFAADGPFLDLDLLIEKLSGIESRRIKFDPHATGEAGESSDSADDNTDDIVSETLANIHEQQGKLSVAIDTYQRLKKVRVEKKSFYEEQIKRLKKMETEKGEEE